MRTGKVLRWVCVAVALAVSVGCVRGTPHSAISPPSQQIYVVQPPDVVQVAVTPEEQLTRNCIVRPDGCITFDLIGDVQVAGLTPPQIDDLITERLSAYIKNVEVAVSVESTASKVYYVLGEVGRSGSFPLNGEISARDAVGIAGGPTRRASYKSVYVVRGSPDSPQAFRINLGEMIKQGDTTEDIMLEPDDIVLVNPNVFARVGYFLDNIFFPFQSIFGMTRTVATTVTTGGMGYGYGGYGSGRIGR